MSSTSRHLLSVLVAQRRRKDFGDLVPVTAHDMKLGEEARGRPVTQNVTQAGKWEGALRPNLLIYLVSPVGIEPTTPRLKVSCSTN